MASSSSPFANNSNLKPTTFVFAQSVNNNFTINGTSNIRPNGTILPPMSTGVMTAPTSIVRLNQPLVNTASTQIIPQTVWTSNSTGTMGKIQYSPVMKTETLTTSIPQQSTTVPTTLLAKPVVRQTTPTGQGQKFTETQINDFVGKCRTFLLTLLKLAEKQAPDKLPMVHSCIQDLLDGTIDPESFTQRLHTLYKSQPHTSLVPFFKLALPYMRQIVKNTFGRSITIELLEKLNITTNNNNATSNAPRITTPTTSCVVVNPSLLSQTSSNFSQTQQPVLYTTVQPQQKINLLQQNPPTQTLISSTTSLLGQQQQQQQQARAQINIAGIRPLITTVSPSANTNLLTTQSQNIQPVTQTIISQPDSLLQRTYLTSASSTNLQQTQLITVNPQTIKTEIGSTTSISISTLPPSIQKPIGRTEPEISDGHQSHTTGNDDRNTRHITHDNRLIGSLPLRRRFDHLIKNSQRWEGGPITIHDDSMLALISNATEERLKYLINRIQSNRINSTVVHSDSNNEKLNTTDNNQMVSMEIELNTKRKCQSEENLQRTSDHRNLSTNKKFKFNSNKRQRKVDLHHLLMIMEDDKHLRRSMLYLKTLDRLG